MLEIIVTCILLYAGEKIEVDPPWNVVAVQALGQERQGAYMPAFVYPMSQERLGRVHVTMKRPVDEGEAVALPKACRSEVEVRKP